jgi:Ni/Co efflux regulator RcnB
MPERTMNKTILTIFAIALLAGSMVQAATAGEQQRVKRVHHAAPVVVSDPYASGFRNAYGSDYSYWASRLEGGAISAPAGR